MYSDDIQKQLYDKYVNNKVRKSIRENFSFENFANKIDKKNAFTNVIYVDISSFSNKVEKMTGKEIRDYLEEYYSVALKLIYRFSGQIDKIMGDGIIAMFSPIFDSTLSGKDASDNAFLCSQEILKELYDTEFESKVAIGSGNLFYCKTGLEQVYEEYTAIGNPLTIAYRLESIASKNQILTLRNCNLSSRILNQDGIDMSSWNTKIVEAYLQGIGRKKILISIY